MGTIIGIETNDGTLLAGDRRHVDDGTVRSDTVDRVLDLDGVGAVAIGEPGDVSRFHRRLAAELRTYRMEHGDAVSLERVARTAATIAEDVGIDAIVSARDDDGFPRLRAVGRDGSVLSDDTVVYGTGAQMAASYLDEIDPTTELTALEAHVRDLVASIAERDPATGTAVDIWTLVRDDGN